MKTFRIRSTSDLPEVAEAILDARAGRTVIAFRGGMGAGKTTLIRAVCDRLGVTDTVTSPTFAIVNEYRGDGTPPVYHFDFYRIDRIEEAFDFGYEEYFFSGNLCLVEWPEKIEEAFDFGYEEYFFSGNLCLVEWPEKIESLLPDDAMNVRIDVPDEDERVISID